MHPEPFPSLPRTSKRIKRAPLITLTPICNTQDITEGDADGVNIKEATNTLLGNHSLRREFPRRPKHSALIAARAAGRELVRGGSPPKLKPPSRLSNYNPHNPEPAFDISGVGNWSFVPTGWQSTMPYTSKVDPDAPPKEIRRRKMDQFPPPTPHQFKSFRL